MGRRALVEDVKSLGENVGLAEFLAQAGVDLEDVYANGRCWTGLRRDAGFEVPGSGPDDAQIERALSRMLHLDDPWRLLGIRELLSAPSPPEADAKDPLQRMLFMLLGYVRRPLSAIGEAWNALWASPLRGEIVALLTALDDRVRRVTLPLAGSPLHVHATYTLDEILAAFDERTSKGGVKRIQTGVYYCESVDTDLLFITLEKSAKDYSPTTLYNDYAMSATRFHWESQSNCHDRTSTGLRYTRAIRDAHGARDAHGSHDAKGAHGAHGRVLLFVRARRSDERGETMPYTFLGRAFYLEHRGGRPMQVQWELEIAMPAGMYQETKVAAG